MITPTVSEKILTRFNQWANNRIADLEATAGYDDEHRRGLRIRIADLQNTKNNLSRIVRGVENE